MPGGILMLSSAVGGIVGLDDAIVAMEIMAVEPRINTLIIRGPPGTGKSTVIRAFSSCVMGEHPLTIPANATEDRVFGCLDLESALRGEGFRLQQGILAEADGRVLCVDDIDRLDASIIRGLVESVRSGTVRIERDGISAEYRTHPMMVATTLQTSSYASRKLLERFDVCVTIRPSADADFRSDVISSNLSDCVRDSMKTVADTVTHARGILDTVVVPDGVLRTIVDICLELGVRGYDGELSMYRTTRALAAIGGRTSVTIDDVKRAACLCLEHRRTRRLDTPKKKDTVRFFSGTHMKRFIHDERKTPSVEREHNIAVTEPTEASSHDPGEKPDEDVIIELGERFESMDLFERAHADLENEGVKRRSFRDDSRRGRCIGSKIPDSSCTDIAVDATIRAAAPYQGIRHRDDDGRVVITKEDLRENIRERRKSYLYLFMIDNSGSLVIRSRMRSVKASVYSMLSDHYVRRDSVGIGTFNEKFTGMVLHPTKSVERVKGVLDTLPVGEKTPLSDALIFARDYVQTYTRKHRAESCVVIFMTDGMANIPLRAGACAFDESIELARTIDVERTSWIVVDTSPGSPERLYAKELSDALRGQYYRLDDLKTDASNGI